jgi:hypothetical protein
MQAFPATANVVPTSLIVSNLMMEAIRSSKTLKEPNLKK